MLKLLWTMLQGASTRVGRPAFVVFVIGATLCAPGTALGLNLRTMLGELNEHRAELDGSEHSRGMLPQVRSTAHHRVIAECGAGKLQIRSEIFNSHCRSVIDELRAVPAADCWISPLRL